MSEEDKTQMEDENEEEYYEEKYNEGKIEISQPLSTTNNPKKYPRSWLETLLANNPNPKTPKSLRTKALVVAPMVDQSDYPFRALCRNYGANICYTPMIHSRLFIDLPNYRRKFWDFKTDKLKKESPLIVQFCGHDPEVLLKACRYVCNDVDAIDLNCGCPQNIAKRGKYGAFLLEKEELLLSIVRALSSAPDINVPICVKVRLLPSGVEDSLNLYRELVKAGASLICIHGRNRLQRGVSTGSVDWDAIQRAVLDPDIGGKIPVLANGGISNLEDVKSCLNYTKADGVMSSEAILEYPALFLDTPVRISRIQLAREYIAIAKQYPPDEGGQGNGIKCVRTHIHRILHADLQAHEAIRDMITFTTEIKVLEDAIDELEGIHTSNNHEIEKEVASWYTRHSRNRHVKTDGGIHFISLVEEVDDDETCLLNVFGDNDDY